MAKALDIRCFERLSIGFGLDLLTIYSALGLLFDRLRVIAPETRVAQVRSPSCRRL